MSNCLDCNEECNCQILPIKLLEKRNSQLANIGLERRPELFEQVNYLVLSGQTLEEGLLGEKCYNSLCQNITEATATAKQWAEDNANSTDPQAQFWYYLEDRWATLLKNRTFQNAYASYLLYYYYHALTGMSETSLDGDIRHERTSGTNDGDGSKNTDMAVQKAKASRFLMQARSFAGLFKRNFLDRNIRSYPCLVHRCDCQKRSCGCCGNYFYQGIYNPSYYLGSYVNGSYQDLSYGSNLEKKITENEYKRLPKRPRPTIL